MALADGNHASVGDLIITRSNDRQLRLTATDWVKNGDRWTVRAISGSGDLDVQHLRNRHRVRLPAAYVQTSAELGYATTVHAAQGLSVDTMHGLATGEESRQQLYTMLTRGRVANHLYLQVVGDGDPHSIIWPETVRPVHGDRPARADPGPRRRRTLRNHPAVAISTTLPPGSPMPPSDTSTHSMWPPKIWRDQKSWQLWRRLPSRPCRV